MSIFSNVIRCSVWPECVATVISLGQSVETDDATVEHLRRAKWQVFNGEWTCPDHLPPERSGRHWCNPHCLNCGDLRGGAYGHRAFECTWGKP